MRELAEELREYTAMKYAGDCKCGKCQLVPRELVERIYHTLNGSAGHAQQAKEPVAYRWRQPGNKHWIYDPTPEWIEDHKLEIELEALFTVADTSTDRQCTCHPSEAPAPCQKKYAYSECRAAADSSPDREAGK